MMHLEMKQVAVFTNESFNCWLKWFGQKNETPLRRINVVLALTGTIFVSEKQTILCLKCNSLNINFLFVELYTI